MVPKENLANKGNSLFVWGAQIRRNSSMSLFNSIILGYPNGLFIDATKGVSTDNNITSGSLLVQNTIIAGSPSPVLYSNTGNVITASTTATVTAWFNTAAYANSIVTTNAEVGLTAAFNYTAPDFNPTANSIAVAGAKFDNAKLASGFTNVTYKGACAAGDTWWKTWTKFN